MNFSITSWSLFLLFGCFQAIILASAFAFQRKQARRSNVVMTVLMIIFATILFDHSLRLSHLYKSIPWGLYISDALWYLIAPLLWFYLKFRVEGNKFRLVEALHFIPFLFFAFAYRRLPFASSQIKVDIFESYLNNDSVHPLIVKIFILIMMIQMLCYLLASLFFLNNLEKRYKETHSGNEIGEVSLLRRIIAVFSLYFLFEFSFSTFRNFNNIQNKFIENWSLVVWTFFLIMLSYVIIRFPGQMFGLIRLSKQKYEGIDFDAIKLRLVKFMKESKPFLDNGLTLSQLAQAVDIKPHQLSHLLNSTMNTTFYDFINIYRVRYVALQLDKGMHEQYSIYGIAQMSGFKSKASFYTFFKKAYNLTPKRYLIREKPEGRLSTDAGVNFG